MQLQENLLFHDRYRLLRLLGRGGFSEVWLVEDTTTMITVVLKVYASGTGLDEDGTSLFRKEFSLGYNFNHSNLLKPTHFDIYDRRPYLILPFCERGSALKLAGRISEKEAWDFLHSVASGLAYLHRQDPPVIHQDIKPDNVLMDNSGQFMITDFGISTKVRSTLRKSVGQQSGGGTFAYMGPERFSKDNIPIKASDIWALGSTLYELLTGDTPFSDHGGVIQKSGAEIPDVKENFSTDLKHIITLCLQKETWDRPTAEQIVKWADQHFRGKIIFDPDTPPPPPSPGKKSNTGMIVGICIAVFVLISLAVGIGVYMQEKNQRIQELYSQFEDYKKKGDSSYAKGEDGYKEALGMYDEALKVAKKIEESGKTVADSNEVLDKKDQVAAEIDNIFDEYVKMGDKLSQKDDEISKLQTIANYEDALKWKDDSNVRNKLNRLKQ